MTCVVVALATVCALLQAACERGLSECETAQEFVGLSEAEARALARQRGWTMRILRDGSFATADLRADRVNVHLDNDRVAVATRC